MKHRTAWDYIPLAIAIPVVAYLMFQEVTRALNLDATVERLTPSIVMVLLCGFAALPGLISLWGSPRLPPLADKNALAESLVWFARVAWAGAVFALAAVVGAVAGISATYAVQLEERKYECARGEHLDDACATAISSLGGRNALEVMLEGTLLPLLAVSAGSALLLFGLRACVTLLRANQLGHGVASIDRLWTWAVPERQRQAKWAGVVRNALQGWNKHVSPIGLIVLSLAVLMLGIEVVGASGG